MLKPTYSFKIKVTTEYGEDLEGEFEIRRPNLEDMSAISAGMSRMNQGEPYVSPQYEALFSAIVNIEVCGVRTPPWWPRISKEPLDTGSVIKIGAEMAKARRASLPFRAGSEKDESSMDQQQSSEG